MKAPAYKKADPRKLLVLIVYCITAFIALFEIGILELIRQEWVSDEVKDYGMLYFGIGFFIIMSAIVFALFRFGRKLQRTIAQKPLPPAQE